MTAAILDIDGTLVDSNYHHAIAWYRAFRLHGITVPVWQVHRAIGMGGDQLVVHLAGEGFENEHGDAVRDAEHAYYAQLISEVQPLEGARELIADLKGRGHAIVLASSAKPSEVAHYLDLLDARPLADAWTDAGDVDRTKPHPDLVEVALERAGTDDAVMIGDSVWDCEAAKNAGLKTIAVRTGGFGVDELTEAGAVSVHESIVHLREALDDSPLA